MIPRLYVMGWRNDMENRKHIINNAELGGVPHFEHDDNLFWEKKEQLTLLLKNNGSRKARGAKARSATLIVTQRPSGGKMGVKP